MAPGQQRTDNPRVRAIAQAAKELVEQRDRWLNAKGLSEAVFAVYGWQPALSDEEILEKLLELNLAKSKADNHF